MDLQGECKPNGKMSYKTRDIVPRSRIPACKAGNAARVIRRSIDMILQSKKVLMADRFVPAQIVVEDGKIAEIYPYGTKEADVDYGDQ